MVYSPGIVLIRDDNEEWRSPVVVDHILASAAGNAGEIRRELEREVRVRTERIVMEYWKKKRGEERRKENERAIAEAETERGEQKCIRRNTEAEEREGWFGEVQKEMDKGRAIAKVEDENEKGEVAAVEKPKGKRKNIQCCLF
jgi:hypothetical protein